MATIVVADDDDDIREMVVFKLTQSGHDVTAASDGAAAIQACRRVKPDLAVLDVMMPGMTGMEACAALHDDPETTGIPVILLTARAQEMDVAQGFAAGATDYVVKPFSPKELAQRVETVLARNG